MNIGGIIKDAIALFAITLVAGLCLGFVYNVTENPIADTDIANTARTRIRIIYSFFIKITYRRLFQDWRISVCVFRR